MGSFILYIVIGALVLATLYSNASNYTKRNPERVLFELLIWPVLLIRWALSKP